MTSTTACIACSIFQKELEYLKDEKKIDCDLFFIDSHLHMKPSLLNGVLTPFIKEKKSEGKNVLLVYGDCHPFIDQVAEELKCRRTAGQNCSEILLGREEYRRRMGAGSFFLMPEWVGNWADIFKGRLGLHNRRTAQAFMKSMHTSLIYIDTGLHEIPQNSLYEMSRYCGLPVEILKIDLGHLLLHIQQVLKGDEG